MPGPTPVVTYTGSGQTRLRDLRTLEDFARTAGVRYDTVSAYRSRGYLPTPIGDVGGTPVWSEAQLRAWAAKRPGRGAPGRARPRLAVSTASALAAAATGSVAPPA